MQLAFISVLTTCFLNLAGAGPVVSRIDSASNGSVILIGMYQLPMRNEMATNLGPKHRWLDNRGKYTLYRRGKLATKLLGKPIPPTEIGKCKDEGGSHYILPASNVCELIPKVELKPPFRNVKVWCFKDPKRVPLFATLTRMDDNTFNFSSKDIIYRVKEKSLLPKKKESPVGGSRDESERWSLETLRPWSADQN
ncbi:hypothetical protein AMATHDRAFT_5519 [Amanita thiersii Skay4041]|uniref:Uncharacterized protein n=1 Tax=Amanita thiersii Skay4041 TaxID=703135 RepID=A0A2A9NDS3_9AGAR|nr:hypothetical protein AMATHDRAFT_5519 [Amanita thiersii Skay4041]